MPEVSATPTPAASEAAPEYGDVVPTMVNGQLLPSTEAEAATKPSLLDEIASAFTNARQITVVSKLHDLFSGGASAPTATPAVTAEQFAALERRLTDLESTVKALQESTASALNQLREEVQQPVVESNAAPVVETPTAPPAE